MRAKIIRIGNSQGIRIPKVLLDQARLGNEVELEVDENNIVIRPAAHPRQGWDEKFRLMADGGDDAMLDDGTETKWDEDEWEW
jgi:antitoxin MazE